MDSRLATRSSPRKPFLTCPRTLLSDPSACIHRVCPHIFGWRAKSRMGRYLRQPAKLECVELSEKKAASKSREPRLTYMTWQLWRKLNQPTGRLASARNYSLDSVLQNPWYRSLVRLFVCVKLLLVKCQSLWWMSQDPPIGIRRLLVCLLFEMLLVAVLHPVPYTPMTPQFLTGVLILWSSFNIADSQWGTHNKH